MNEFKTFVDKQHEMAFAALVNATQKKTLGTTLGKAKF
jgi:hypothetical protein